MNLPQNSYLGAIGPTFLGSTSTPWSPTGGLNNPYGLNLNSGGPSFNYQQGWSKPPAVTQPTAAQAFAAQGTPLGPAPTTTPSAETPLSSPVPGTNPSKLTWNPSWGANPYAPGWTPSPTEFPAPTLDYGLNIVNPTSPQPTSATGPGLKWTWQPSTGTWQQGPDSVQPLGSSAAPVPASTPTAPSALTASAATPLGTWGNQNPNNLMAQMGVMATGLAGMGGLTSDSGYGFPGMYGSQDYYS